MRDPHGLVGTTLDRRYAVRRVVAEGGFGVVYFADHLALGLPVALKVLRAEVLENEANARAGAQPSREEGEPTTGATLVARFEQEAKLLARLKHPAIVELHDAAHLADGTPYLVLSWIEGETLDARIRRLGPSTPREVVELLAPVVAAITHAHEQGVVHRDLKPGNVMVVDTGSGPRTRVLDFGVARWTSPHGVATTTTSKTGLSVGYAAPEQYGKEFGPIDARTDEFALAALVFAMITGKPAFPGETLTEVFYATCAKPERPSMRAHRPEISESIDAVVRKALSVKPDDRYPSVAAFWSALSSAVSESGDAPVMTLPGGPPKTRVGGSIPAAATLPSPSPPQPRTQVDEAFAATQPAPKKIELPAEPRSIAGTVREGEAPPSVPMSSRPRRGAGTVIAFLVVGAIVGGVAYAAGPWFSAVSKPSTHPSWLPPSASNSSTTNASSSNVAPVAFDPCSAIKDDEACIRGGRVHRGPFDCSSAGAQVDHKNACPPSDETIATFALDKTEAPLGKWLDCYNAGKCEPLDLNDLPETPARGVTFAQAQSYCAWMGKRLPKDAEWELAAAGPGDAHRSYPWGNGEPNDKLAVFSVEGAARTGPLAVGSLPAGATPEGVLDLAGNVSEWTSTSAPTSTLLPNATNGDVDVGAPRRWVRGGSYLSEMHDLRTWAREAYPESWSGHEVGLRCARDLPTKNIKK